MDTTDTTTSPPRRRLTDGETFHLIALSLGGTMDDHLRDVHGLVPAHGARERQVQHFDAHGYPHNALAGPAFRHMNRRPRS